MSLIRRILGQQNEPGEEKEPVNDKNRRYRGKIFRIQHEKGYGFISSKEIPFTRIFFHWSALVPDTLNFKNLEEGMIVEFNATGSSEKGTRAIKIRVIETNEE